MSDMLSYIRTLSLYNVWANRKILDFVLDAGEKKADKVLVSSFPTISLTLIHIWDAQHIWLERMNGMSAGSWPGQKFNGNLIELADGLRNSSDDLVAYCESVSIKELTSQISYLNPKGDRFSNSVQEILTHLFNHSTFHRGQIVTMLRNTGFTSLSQTDLIEYYRTVEA
jgi:uncharacterized damage-inducible protein DinB